LNRGDVYDVHFPQGRRPAVIATRDAAIPLLRSLTVVGITSRIRGLPTEVSLGSQHGLARDCVANCDNVFTLPKQAFGEFRGALGFEDVRRFNVALEIALALD
jgi:mRNA interferase MazF